MRWLLCGYFSYGVGYCCVGVVWKGVLGFLFFCFYIGVEGLGDLVGWCCCLCVCDY